MLGNDDPGLLIQEGERFSKGAMVLLAVSKLGVGRLIPPPEGIKIDGDAYYRLMQEEVAPDVRMKMKRMGNPDV